VVPSTIAAMMRGDRKARGASRWVWRSPTAFVSSWTAYANGEPWELLNGGPITYYAARIFLTNRSFATEAGMVAPRTLGFTIGRWIYGGMHEDLDIANNSRANVSNYRRELLRVMLGGAVVERSCSQTKGPCCRRD
jgi:hypothetical protein